MQSLIETRPIRTIDNPLLPIGRSNSSAAITHKSCQCNYFSEKNSALWHLQIMYQLSTSIPYLLNRLGVRLGVLFSQRIQTYDLTLPMYRVLAALSEQPNQKLSELSSMTAVELSTMSRLIGTMADRDLVSRVRLPADERTVRINLTVKGAELATALSREAQHYEDVAVSALRSAEVDRLRATIVRIYDALDILEVELVTQAPGSGSVEAQAK